MDQNYNVSKKLSNGKWWTFGKIKKNKFNNLDLGMRVTTELRELLASTPDGAYLNFSLFADDRDSQPKREQPQSKPAESQSDEPAWNEGGEVPF